MNFKSIKKRIIIKRDKGFTILELIVSLTIFAMMTALLLAKYGTFNQGVLLTNLAYDVALSIRNAQFYGLNVKSSSRTSNDFSHPYGVHFEKNRTLFYFFVDLNDNGLYDITDNITPFGVPDEQLSITNIRRGGKVSGLCAVGCDYTNISSLDITFKRPDPSAKILTTDAYNYTISPANDAEITLESSDGTTKKISVNSTGQISVK